jgi:4-diphosphocytidyl-2-C-methyl-D-erythritol kinase
VSDGPAAGTNTIAVAAPAKINLYLHVTGRRDDGYHELDSLVAFADVHDTVAAAPAADLSLMLSGPFAAALADTAEPTGQAGSTENLVLQAARLLAAAAGIAPRATLALDKRLPVASGIGGGSADAAAALKVLADLWRLAPDAVDVEDIARRLGADVPVCLAGHAAYMAGIGERLDPAPPLPAAGLLLANPGVPVATPAVFKARRGPFSPPGRFEAVPADAVELAAMLAPRRNDLAEPALTLAPEVGLVLAALAADPTCLVARMSGSGATCFALYADPAAASAAAARLRPAHPAWWLAPGRLVTDCATVAA